MVSQPRLFLDALRANQARRDGERLRGGPEGECIGDLRCLEAVIARLRKRVADAASSAAAADRGSATPAGGDRRPDHRA